MKWIEGHPLQTAVIFVVVPALVGLLITAFPIDVELRKSLYSASLTLIFVALIGSVVKTLLDDYARQRQKRENEASLARQRREENAGFLQRVLNDLKSVHDRVGRARVLIPAHRSARTYGDEMRDLIEASVSLKNVIRALHDPVEGLGEAERNRVLDEVGKMESYLETLATEFRDEYKALSNQQRIYEARVDALLKQQGEQASLHGVFDGNEEVWKALQALKHLNGLMDTAEDSLYEKGFGEPLDEASVILRTALNRLLSGRSAGTKVDSPSSSETVPLAS